MRTVPPAIYYYAHDVPRASGGVAVLYEHVSVLRCAGFNASILHTHSGFVPTWLSHDVPIYYVDDDFRPEAKDFVVIPEDFSAAVQQFATVECRRVVFCQNQFYAAMALSSLGDWRDYGVEGVIASTVKVRMFLELAGWQDVPMIPYAIDPVRFRPAEKSLQIAYMPRKRALDAVTLRFMFPCRFPKYADVPWIELDGLHQDEVARAFSRSAIFLSLGENESMGLPALEAMSAGALVAGFHGDGDLGLPEALGSALWVDGVDQALVALGSLVEWLRRDAPEANRQRRAAIAYAGQYSIYARDQALLACWRSLIAR